jgi:hypothetical protein
MLSDRFVGEIFRLTLCHDARASLYPSKSETRDSKSQI